jgi:hypothetical protein
MKTNIHIFIISRSFLLRMRNFSDKCCKENQNTHFVSSNFFFPPENRVGYEIVRKNIVKCGRTRITMWRLRNACWIPKATNKHWLCNAHCFSAATVVARTPSLLRKVCIACLTWINSWQHIPNCVLHLLLKVKRTPLQFAARRSRSSRWKKLCGLCHNIALVAVTDYYELAFKKWKVIIVVHLLN